MMDQCKALWQAVFGDGPDFLNPWFDTFYRPKHTAVIQEDGHLIAAAYLLPVGSYLGQPCCHLYAVAVAPAYRGRGLGLAVTQKAVSLAREAGFAHILLHPADCGLFSFYEKCGFTPGFPVVEEELAVTTSAPPAIPVSIERYRSKRAALLAHRPAIEHSPELLNFFVSAGGLLYCGEDWCAAVESDGSHARILEWLGSSSRPGPLLLASLVGGASRTLLRRPPEVTHSGLPFAMVYGSARGQEDAWPGLALD